jgi:hypothetical protein
MADAVYQSPPLLVFVHIPKTAGTTLQAVLNMNQPGARSRALANVFKGGGGLSKVPMDRFRRDHGPDLKDGVRLIRGHIPLGIREYLPSERELRFFTFLRDPVERILSHYYSIRDRREGEDEPARYAESPLPPDPTLDDALAAGYVHDNLHTRMLCGDPEPFGEVTEEMLEAAKRNLREDLAFFGLTERFDESLVLAKRRLGLRSILYRSSGRVNPARPRGGAVPAELRRSAERSNRYDIELYRYARELFETRLSSRDLEFEVELAALEAAKADGEPDVKTPVPASFGGDEEAWRMVVNATAAAQRLEQQLAGVASRAAGDRARTRVLKREVERRDAVPERMVELERELQRLRASAGSPSDDRSDRTAVKGDRSQTKRAGSKPERTDRRPAADGRKQRRARPKREGKPRRKPRTGAPAGERSPYPDQEG